MTWNHASALPAGIEYDRPSNVSLVPPQFAVDEIGDANQKQAKRNAAGDIIANAQEREFEPATVQPDGK